MTPNNIVKKNQRFSITIDINFPNKYINGPLKLDSDLAGRLKFLSVAVNSNGANVPCKRCIGRGNFSSNEKTLKWSIEDFTVLNLIKDSERSKEDNNKLR